MDLSLSHKLFKNIRNNRWQNDFMDQEKIGRGGFASVYSAKNCFDEQQYAVKKIKMSVKDIKKNFEQEIQRVLDEAKFLAQVNHQNVLRYYNSWLEATTKPSRGCPTLKSKPSLFKKLMIAQNARQKSSLSEISHEDESEEEKHIDDSNEEDEDSPAVVFERSSDTSEEGESECSSRDELSEGFSKVLEDRDNLFEKKIGAGCNNRQRPVCWTGKNSQTPVGNKAVKFDFNMNHTSEHECSTPLLGEESLESVTLFIQTELCSETLDDYLQNRNQVLQQHKHKNMAEYNRAKRGYMKEALVFAKQILRGLSHIHLHNIVHRDLKPSNIFLVDKHCKIGDFGLIKRLRSMCMEASPIMVQEEDRSAGTDMVNDQFKLESSDNFEFEMVEEDLPHLSFQKVISEPLWQEEKYRLEVDLENLMTKSVGTKIYASPEQWQADQTKFDQRADIFSLGVILLLLFHPMGTYMEQARLINESKEGRIPTDLENDLPDIAKIIKKMLSINPTERPTLDTISQALKLPLELSTDLAGLLYAKKENSAAWRKKHFKLIDGKLYIFSKDGDKKAEVVYDLVEWRVQMKDMEALINEDAAAGKKALRKGRSSHKTNENESENQSENSEGLKERTTNNIITIENSLQLGCSFKGESMKDTMELYRKLNRNVQQSF